MKCFDLLARQCHWGCLLSLGKRRWPRRVLRCALPGQGPWVVHVDCGEVLTRVYLIAVSPAPTFFRVLMLDPMGRTEAVP